MTMSSPRRRPIALIVLDGWGQAPDDYPLKFNAVRLANTPVVDGLRAKYPTTLVKTSGNDVGLPDGVMGNSEVGHMNLGAGRVVWQELVRIDKAAERDDFASIAPLRDAMLRAKASGRRVHLMGCASDGSVHSVDRHYFALLRLAKEEGLTGDRVAFHAFTDGRDCPPRSGAGHVAAIRGWMAANGTGVIATVSGRYFAMDRDKRWDRVKRAYDALVHGVGAKASDPVEAVERGYAAGVTDEFIEPCVMTNVEGGPVATIADGDEVISFNYRADRVREMTTALTYAGFEGFDRGGPAPAIRLTTMTPYMDGLPAVVAFPHTPLTNTLGQVVSAAGLTQLRIAETEKYPHVSFFFNGGVETPNPGEDRKMVASARDVATYDLKPEMSAPGIAELAAASIADPGYDMVILNFANADMVGHTGVVEAATRACEAADAALGTVLEAIRKSGGAAIVTADHGNSEEMWNFEADAPHTQHTTNPVPLTLVDDTRLGATLREGGRLADIAPTILELLGVPKPAEMDGCSLLQP